MADTDKFLLFCSLKTTLCWLAQIGSKRA